MKHYTLYLLFSIAFMFTACASRSSISYEQSKLNLQTENKVLQIQAKTIKSNKENFGNLFLEQKLLRLDDQSIVMFEDIQVDLAYTFAQSTSKMIKSVFDAKKVVKVYDHNMVFGYQLVVENGHLLNVVVSQSYDQELTMIYGMNSIAFDRMLKNFNTSARPAPYRNAISLTNETIPGLSKWTTVKINFVPLVEPLPRFMRM